MSITTSPYQNPADANIFKYKLLTANYPIYLRHVSVSLHRQVQTARLQTSKRLQYYWFKSTQFAYSKSPYNEFGINQDWHLGKAKYK